MYRHSANLEKAYANIENIMRTWKKFMRTWKKFMRTWKSYASIENVMRACILLFLEIHMLAELFQCSRNFFHVRGTFSMFA